MIRTRSLLIWSQTRYHCATESTDGNQIGREFVSFSFFRNSFFFNCNTKDTTNKKKTKATYNTTNLMLLLLLTVQYFLRVQILYYFYSLFVFFSITHPYTWRIIMPSRFPLGLKHLTIIVLDSDIAFNFVFSLN